MIRQTHTCVMLDLSQAAYDEIAGKLKAAAYGQCFGVHDGRESIDLSGIAIQVEEEQVNPPADDESVSCKCNRKLIKKHPDLVHPDSGHMDGCPKHILWVRSNGGGILGDLKAIDEILAESKTEEQASE